MRFSRLATIAILFTLLIVMRQLPPIVMNSLQTNFRMNITPWLWNFTPLWAVCLYCGAKFRQRWLAVLLPLAAQIVGDAGYWLMSGDFWQGFGMVQTLNYILIAAFVVVGMTLPRQPSAGRLAMTGATAMTAHFFISNFAVWALTPWYTHNVEGLAECFTLAIPFYPNSVVSTLVFGQLLFSLLNADAATEEAPAAI
jgi:hypothetical protein